MINEFSLRGLKLKVTKLEAGVLTRGQKRKFPYQWAVLIDNSSKTTVKPYPIHGQYSIKEFPGYSCYILEKTKEVSDRGEYKIDEIKILLKFLSVSINTIKIPRYTEFLVRALNDESISSRFYSNVDYKSLKCRISYLEDNPDMYKWGTERTYSEQYNRRRYSIYQLVNDLVSDNSEICIDNEITDYKKISISRRSIDFKKEDNIWGKIIYKQGNKERANLGITYKVLSTDVLSSMCLVRDGGVWTKTIIVKVNSPRLKQRLHSAGIVWGTLISKDELILDLTKLPIIGKQYLSGIDEESYFSACLYCMIQEHAWKKVKKIDKKDDKKVSKGEYHPATSSYLAPCLDSKILGSSSIILNSLVEKQITDFSVETRKKELDRAREVKRDITFKYLMSKRMQFWCSKEINKINISMKYRELKVNVSD